MSNDIRLAGSDGDRGKSGGSMNANGKSAIRIVRNTGGGTSQCCSRFPVAAPARVTSRRDPVPREEVDNLKT